MRSLSARNHRSIFFNGSIRCKEQKITFLQNTNYQLPNLRLSLKRWNKGEKNKLKNRTVSSSSQKEFFCKTEMKTGGVVMGAKKRNVNIETAWIDEDTKTKTEKERESKTETKAQQRYEGELSYVTSHI